jgi:hypothetical protein
MSTVNDQVLVYGLTAAGEPIPLKVSADGTLQVAGGAGGGGGGSSIDREVITTTYRVKTAFTGASVGDIVTQAQVVDVTDVPATIGVLWRNQTTGLDLASPPAMGNIEIVSDSTLGATSDAPATTDTGNWTLTALIKRALQNWSTLLGRVPAIFGAGMPVSDGGDSITIDTFNVKFRDAFETFPNANWGVVQQGAGDILRAEGNAGGASYAVISLDPLAAATETWIESVGRYGMPVDMAVGMHMSQRTLGQEFSVELVSDEAVVAPFSDIAVASIQQTTTTLSVTTPTPHGLRVGQRFGVRAVPDSRLNYAALVVATTPSPTTLTATAGPGGNIPSVTAGPFTTGFIYARSAMGGSPNGTSMLLENATATNAAFYVKSEGGDAMPIGGTLAGSHSVTIGTMASVQAINAALNYAFRPTTEYRLTLLADRLQWSDVAVDSGAQSSGRATITQVVPNPDVVYKLRLRAVNAKSLTVPVAQIVSAVKTGTTTATITTDVPHGLTTADFVNIYGIRDQAAASFPNLTTATAVAAVLNATQFNVVIGTASTVTSYGGYVSRVNGGQVQQGAITQAVQSATRTSNVLVLVGSAAWTNLQIGDLANAVALRDIATGASLGLDGAYRVRDIQTTSLFLEPVTAPTGADLATTNCGGAILKRTDLRVSFARLFDFERVRTEALPRPSNDIAAAAPVAVQNVPAVSQSGTWNVGQILGTAAARWFMQLSDGTNSPSIKAASVAALAADPSLVVALSPNSLAPIQFTDVASAAIAATATAGPFTPLGGLSYEVNIPVTAMTGTLPTMDVNVEESDDGGTNWFVVYSFPRINATGMYRSPKLPLTGNRVRYVQTLGGTSPNFTRAINRVQCNDAAPILRQLIDRSINLTGANSVTPTLNVQNTRNVQMAINLGAATTPPILQLEGSDDNGSSWLPIGSTLTGVASSTVQLTVNNVQYAAIRARVSTVGATVTPGYVLIKGF